jgi:hypothetical protein
LAQVKIGERKRRAEQAWLRPLFFSFLFSGIFYTAFSTQAGLRVEDWNNFQTLSPPGVMLYRQVPEPSVAIWLLLAAGRILKK